MKQVQGYQTAISRTVPPEPLRWLRKRGLLLGRVLDYGSGKGHWFDTERYDPEFYPYQPKGKFDTIVVNYVLNVIDEGEQEAVIGKVQSLLALGGTAYFAVRRDIPRSGKPGKGTYQRYVELPFNSVSSNATREIYSWHNFRLYGDKEAKYSVSSTPKSRKATPAGLGEVR